jgi:hypothetical protein
MTAAELLLLMATLQCHTLVVDVPERRESVVQTVCVKTEVVPLKPEVKPVVTKPVVKAPVKKKARVTGCKRKWYWKNKRKRWRCVR